MFAAPVAGSVLTDLTVLTTAVDGQAAAAALAAVLVEADAEAAELEPAALDAVAGHFFTTSAATVLLPLAAEAAALAAALELALEPELEPEPDELEPPEVLAAALAAAAADADALPAEAEAALELALELEAAIAVEAVKMTAAAVTRAMINLFISLLFSYTSGIFFERASRRPVCLIALPLWAKLAESRAVIAAGATNCVPIKENP